MTKILSTEPADYATETDRDFPAFAKKLRKVAALVQPTLSPTEIDQFVERWGTFVRANDIVLEATAQACFQGVLSARTAKDPDVLNLDPPRLYLREHNVGKLDDFVKRARGAWDGNVGE